MIIINQIRLFNKILLLSLYKIHTFQSIKTLLVLFILNHKKTGGSTRINTDSMQLFNSEIMEFSCSTISVKLLNIFLNNFLTLNDRDLKQHLIVLAIYLFII